MAPCTPGRWQSRYNDIPRIVNDGQTKIDAEAKEWPEPKIIKTELLPVKPFDAYTLLPDALKAWVEDSAGRMPCPPDYIAAAVIVALGSVIGARCVIKPKRYDEWAVVPNLWGGIVGLPSAKKTPAMNAALNPLDRLIAKAMEDFKEGEAAYTTEKLLHDVREKALEKLLKQAAEKETNQDNEDNHEQ